MDASAPPVAPCGAHERADELGEKYRCAYEAAPAWGATWVFDTVWAWLAATYGEGAPPGTANSADDGAQLGGTKGEAVNV